MASDVPVSDVLCEAMEYLSKLGSNLRTRSQNLKEKRISKNKLRNSHAVQKAASKVLLICELSKKSLDNVEAGVRRVLSFLEASQAPIGAKDSDIINTSRHKYHYFEYQSCKLRIAKKISLEHYMSVKVLAKAMSTKSLNKYPVHYDCKLKRERRKMTAKLSGKQDVTDSGSHSESSDHLHTVPDLNPCSPIPIDDCLDAKCDSDQKNMANKSESENKASKNKRKNSEENDNSLGIISSKSMDAVDCNLHKNKCNQDEKSSGEEAEYSKAHKSKTKKKRSIRVANVYSSDSNEESKKSNCEEAKEDCVIDNSDHEPKAKKLKLNTPENEACQLNSDTEVSEEHLPNRDLDNNSTSKICESTQNESSEHSKPLIRCVNLSKLLKPGIASINSNSGNTQQSQSNNLSRSKNERQLLKKEKKQVQKKQVQNEKDEIFWTQKRKEVREFKSKEFSVRIERLPNLTFSFLLAYKLTRITKQGNTICEINNENDTPNSKQMKAVKHALLNDSDSDECTEILTKDSELPIDKDRIKVANRNKKSEQDKIKHKKMLKQNLKNNSVKELDEADKEGKGDHHKTVDQINAEVVHCANESQDDRLDETFRSNLLADNRKESQNHTDNKQCNVEYNDTELPTKIIQAVKSSLLNDSSDEDINKNVNCSETPTAVNEKTVDQNNSDNQECNIQSSHSSNTVDEGGLCKKDVEKPNNTNEKIKSYLLNDSSDENSNKNLEESPTKVNQNVKSALLNDSSDVPADESVHHKERPKKSKRKQSRKCREKAKQKFKYPSSSDSDEEKPKHKTKKKRTQLSSTSSSDNKKKKTKTIDSD